VLLKLTVTPPASPLAVVELALVQSVQVVAAAGAASNPAAMPTENSLFMLITLIVWFDRIWFQFDSKQTCGAIARPD
jgi:hypothetical protein